MTNTRNKSGRLFPVHDPNSQKYPDRIWYHETWQTPEQITKTKEKDRSSFLTRYYTRPGYAEAIKAGHRMRYATDPMYALMQCLNSTDNAAKRREQNGNDNTH